MFPCPAQSQCHAIRLTGSSLRLFDEKVSAWIAAQERVRAALNEIRALNDSLEKECHEAALKVEVVYNGLQQEIQEQRSIQVGEGGAK
jgi:hypothetical protein